METILLFHIILSAFMTGVTWFVQLVHYPTLRILNREQYQEYNSIHFKPTTFITFPFMLLELISGVWLVVDKPNVNILPYFAVNLALILVIWVSTMVIQVPLHFKISKYPSIKQVNKLIKSNWLRTIIWSGKIIFLFIVYIKYIL